MTDETNIFGKRPNGLLDLAIPRVQYTIKRIIDPAGLYDARITDVFTEHGYTRLRGHLPLEVAVQAVERIRKRAAAANFGA
jgi:hypothetical protein